MREESTFDELTKQRVVACLVARLREGLGAFAGTVGAEHDAAELDQDSAHEVDDLSQSDEYGELQGRLGALAETERQQLRQLEGLDFSRTDVVRDGAVIGFDGQRYVVGVAAQPFDLDGVTYEGISVDAPVHDAVIGLRVGDSFLVDGGEHRIEFVA